MISIQIKTDFTSTTVQLYDDLKLKASLDLDPKSLIENFNYQLDQFLVTNQLKYTDLAGIGLFKGPGSFTGLRAVYSVINTLGFIYNIPLVNSGGDNWLASNLEKLAKKQTDTLIFPDYGQEPRTTLPKK